MANRKALQLLGRLLLRTVAILGLFFFAAPICGAQAKPPAKPADVPQWLQEIGRNPELFAELGRLVTRLQQEVHLPAARSQSRLMPLLPETTMSYVALPNYGTAGHEALDIFRQERQKSAALRNWWAHGEMAQTGPKLEDSLQKFYQLSQYLGDELAVSGASDGHDFKPIFITEIKKPGLKPVLQQLLKEVTGTSKSDVRILEPQDLGAATETRAGEGLLLLVRPDYLVAALDLATLREFNARLDRGSGGFASTAFGKRVLRAYEDNVTMVAAMDMQSIVSRFPANTPKDLKDLAAFRRTGFADMKYLVLEHTSVGGHDVSRSELSFTGPRHGIASWLAAPGPLGSLDFASPKAVMAAAIVLSDPARIFEDIRGFATASDPKAFAGVTRAEQALHLSLRDDFLRLLGGEIAVELESITPPAPVWKVVLQVTDPVHLQRTLDTVQASMQLQPRRFDDAGVSYRVLEIPGKKPTNITYTLVDGYLVIASSPEDAVEAVRLHRSGGSLQKSRRLLAALPPGHPAGVSALLFQDPSVLAALQLQRLAPGMVPLEPSPESTPAVIGVYGEQTAITSASSSATMDAAVVMVVAAIAIPNLLSARVAANESSAVGTLRTVNLAQTMFTDKYPQRGFAPDLGTLGPDPRGGTDTSREHAALLADPPGCAAGTSCEKAGYRFSMAGVCRQGRCRDYVAVATPLNPSAGKRNYCSTADAVIRAQTGPPLTAPPSVSECKTWPPLE